MHLAYDMSYERVFDHLFQTINRECIGIYIGIYPFFLAADAKIVVMVPDWWSVYFDTLSLQMQSMKDWAIYFFMWYHTHNRDGGMLMKLTDSGRSLFITDLLASLR